MFTLGASLRTADLSRTDRVLLWSMRTWVIGLKRRFDVTAPLQAAFAQLGVLAAAELLDALMCVVACGATRTLTIECVCCRRVSEDEQRLLAAVAACQAGRGLEAVFLLREMLAPAACRDANQLLARLGSMLEGNRCGLSRWALEVERFAYDAMAEPSSRRLLH